MNTLTRPSVSEENKIEEISTNLYRRVEEETAKILKQQLKALGVEYDFETAGDIKKYGFPDDPQALATYEYKGHKILGLRISENGMAVEFDVPNLKEVTPGAKVCGNCVWWKKKTKRETDMSGCWFQQIENGENMVLATMTCTGFKLKTETQKPDLGDISTKAHGEVTRKLIRDDKDGLEKVAGHLLKPETQKSEVQND